MDKYNDFDELEDIVLNFTAPEHYEEWNTVHSKGITDALNRKNPVLGAMELIAFHATCSHYQRRELLLQGEALQKVLVHIRRILSIALILLTLIMLKLIGT